MNTILNKIKGYKTIIINVLMILIAVINFMTNDNFLNIKPEVLLAIAGAINGALRFFTTSPIFAKVNEKELLDFNKFIRNKRSNTEGNYYVDEFLKSK